MRVVVFMAPAMKTQASGSEEARMKALMRGAAVMASVTILSGSVACVGPMEPGQSQPDTHDAVILLSATAADPYGRWERRYHERRAQERSHWAHNRSEDRSRMSEDRSRNKVGLDAAADGESEHQSLAQAGEDGRNFYMVLKSLPGLEPDKGSCS
jgi:hypothetical protein